jgi:hypothetical protein
MNPQMQMVKETAIVESNEIEGMDGVNFQRRETESEVSSPGGLDPDLMAFAMGLSIDSSPFNPPHDHELSQNAFEGEVGYLDSTKPLIKREHLPTVENKLVHIEEGLIPSSVAVQPTKRTPIHIAAIARKYSIGPGYTNMDTKISATRGSQGDPDQNFASVNFKVEPSIVMEGSIGLENMDFEFFDKVSLEPQTIESAYNISRSSPSGVFSSSSTYTAQSSPWTGISPPVPSGSPMFYSAQSSPWIGKSPLSLMSSPMFYSAASSPYVTAAALAGAQDTMASFASASDPQRGTMAPPPKLTSEYVRAILTRGLVLPLDQELNWSGKANGGQHVEFAKGEELPFKVLGTIGASLTATVDKIRCRRILLARKTMLCGRRISLHDALAEVEHLQKLRHPHIVQLVGSYLQGKRFSLLLYPVADYDLGNFLENVSDIIQPSSHPTFTSKGQEVEALWSFFGCLTDALNFIHSQATRHLDIKPGNILVKRGPYRFGHRVYIADFGISKSFSSLDHSQTDDPIPRTPKYCAPEVWERGMYGRRADIFSLGCVFTEMLTPLAGKDLDEFADFRSQGGEGKGAFRDSLREVRVWMRDIYLILDRVKYQGPPWLQGSLVGAILGMLEEQPKDRRLSRGNWGFESPTVPTCFVCRETRETFREEPSEVIEGD